MFVISASASYANGNPINDILLKVLNALAPTANRAVEALLPDPLQIHMDKGFNEPSHCVFNPFGSCVCNATWGYNMHFGTISGLKEFKIEEFTDVQLDWNYDGTIAAQFGTVDVHIFNGTAFAEGNVCGVAGHGDGHAGVDLSIRANVTAKVNGTFDFLNHCVKFDIGGTDLNFSTFSLHDPVVDIQIENLPTLKVGPLFNLINKMASDLGLKLLDELNGSMSKVFAELVKKMGCINIWPTEPSDSDAVSVVV